MSDDEIHDLSRLDAWMAARRRSMLAHSLWRPTLAGAAGAAVVLAAAWIMVPRFSVREIVVDHVVQKDVSVDHVVPHDVAVDHIVPHDTVIEIPIPRIVTAATPAEQRFLESPEFSNAEIKGRIVQSVDGVALSFDTGKNWYPSDETKASDSAALVGLWGYCAPTADKTIYHCFAQRRDGVVVPVPTKPLQGRPA